MSEISEFNQWTNPQNPGTGAFVIAGGGGGGGAAYSPGGSASYSNGAVGGRGGNALASITSASNCGGQIGGPELPESGRGGNGGGAACDSSRTGLGGKGGGIDGNSGIGGFGGQKSTLTTLAPNWINSGITSWSSGNGGNTNDQGGGGGAGFGGGGGGIHTHLPGLSKYVYGTGGGGGGSWAKQAMFTAISPYNGNNISDDGGKVMLTFDICSVDPDSPYCADDFNFVQIHPQTSLLAGSNKHHINMIISGSEIFDVHQLDLERISFGFASKRPIAAYNAQPRDINNDGFDDIELRFVIDKGLLRKKQHKGKPALSFNFDSVHCFYGALLDGTPLLGCARPKPAKVKGIKPEKAKNIKPDKAQNKNKDKEKNKN